MQNRFGAKDFFLFLLVLALIVMVGLQFLQRDRVWGKLSTIETKVADVERNVARLSARPVAVAPAAGSAAPGPAGGGAPARDTSWARPGVPISWQAPAAFVSDPASAPDFRPGGVMTEVFNAQMSTITPLIYKDVYGAYVFERVCEYLAEWNPETLQLQGVLAGAWQYPEDGTWLRVRIRDEARFSDGEPVTADDVLYTFEMVRNPQIQAERPRSLLDFVTEIRKIDEKTVEFTFNQVLFTNLSAALGTFPILPKHFYEKFTPTQFNQSTGLVMGSGPFKLRTLDPDNQWTPGTSVVLVRNEQYWGPQPAYDELRFGVITDDMSRLTAFNNGDSEITIPSPLQFRRLMNDEEWKERSEARMWYNIRGGYNFIGFNCGPRNGRPTVFNDVRVRRAVSHLLDRDLIAREFFEGLARPASGPFNSTTAQANPAIKPLALDLSEAGRLLDEAGWKVRDASGLRKNEAGEALSFEFTYAAGGQVTELLARYLKDQGAKAGITVSLRTMDWSVFMKTLDDRDYDAMTLGWSPSSPESDPQQVWHSRFIANQGDNFVQFANAEVDRLIEEGRRELDVEKRMQYWHRMHEILHQEQPYAFLVERPWLRAVSRRVGNFTEYKTGFQYRELFVRGGAGAPTSGN